MTEVVQPAWVPWPAERTAALRRLWGEGHSASKIAAVLGDGVSRAAVLGKVHRLKLASRKERVGYAAKVKVKAKKSHGNKGQPKAAAIRHRVAMRKPKALRFGAVHKPVAPRTISYTSGVWAALPGTTPVPLLDLGAHQCRWPLGDPREAGFGFCGCPVQDGSRYCPEHYARSIRRVVAADADEPDELEIAA